MRYILTTMLIMFMYGAVANELVRPGPHNKIGHTKQENKEDSFFYKLFNDELDTYMPRNSGASASDSNDQILSQIEKLADLRDRGIITEAEFSDKKSILLNKIQ